jgi:hypothetical protein
MPPYGYYTPYGYRGIVNNRWMLFVSEEEYLDYIKED